MTTNRTPQIQFDDVTPRATWALGGPIQNHFSHGRLSATVARHGGLTNILFSGAQHLCGFRIFQAETVTAWNKLFRFCVMIGGKSYYPVLQGHIDFPLRAQKSWPRRGSRLRV